MDRYVIKDKNNSKLFFMDKEIGGGGYCDWIDTDEQLELVLEDPTNVVYYESFDAALEHLLGNENEMDLYLLEGTNEVFVSNSSYDTHRFSKDKTISYFGSIEKLAQ
jgi:hypothetical protein